VVVFSEPVVVTSAGWSFAKNSVAWNISTVSGSGTTWTFNMASSALAGDAVALTCNQTTGNTLDLASNELVAYNGSSVTNSIVGGGADTTPPTVLSMQPGQLFRCSGQLQRVRHRHDRWLVVHQERQRMGHQHGLWFGCHMGSSPSPPRVGFRYHPGIVQLGHGHHDGPFQQRTGDLHRRGGEVLTRPRRSPTSMRRVSPRARKRAATPSSRKPEANIPALLRPST
jgi:hypothetical protein